MVEAIWKMYKEDKFQDAQNAAEDELQKGHNETTTQGLHAILAWCAYRRKDYPKALAEITAAGDTQRARECHAYILAYIPEHRDDKKLLELVTGLSGNINASNALVIRARMLDSTITHDQIWPLAEKFAQEADPANHDVALANLLNNCGRFFQDKARDRRDLKFALGLMHVALAHYGETSNWHHRAALHFWMSHVLEQLGAIPDAFASATACLQSWKNACTIEKNTKTFLEKLGTAQIRVAELAAKLVDFAIRARG